MSIQCALASCQAPWKVDVLVLEGRLSLEMVVMLVLVLVLVLDMLVGGKTKLSVVTLGSMPFSQPCNQLYNLCQLYTTSS